MRQILLVLLIISLAIVPVVSAQDDITPASLAASWLADQQAADGSFANDAATTAMAAIALASVGAPNAEAIAWLEDAYAEDDDLRADVLSILLIAAAIHGEDLSAWLDGAPAEALTSNLRSERGDDIGGLCIGLVAMEHMGEGLPATAISGLKALQNDDGGFAPSAGEASDIVITAICIHTLQLADEIDARDAALTFVAAEQLADGGWGSISSDRTDALTTGFVLMGLNAVGEDLSDWADATAVLETFQDRETGIVAGVAGGPSEDSLDMAASALTVLALGGHSFNPIDMDTSAAIDDDSAPGTDGDFPEGPILDDNWAVVGEGFEMPELDSADDFFMTVIDPFTEEELYGVQIINWTAEYQYTGYIVENFLPGEVLLFMAEQDPSVWEALSVTTLQTLAPDELAKLPDDVQARAAE